MKAPAELSSLFILLLLAAPTPVLAQSLNADAAACSEAEAGAFNFWIGEWDIRARTRPPGSQEWTENKTWIKTRVRSALSGCVVIEESIDKVGSDSLVVGMSMTSYNTHLGKYQQFWVDRQGNTWEYVGGWENESMVLNLEPMTSNGEAIVPFNRTTLIRMVFGEITEDGLIWRYEYSTDDGRTWTSTNEAVYSRVK